IRGGRVSERHRARVRSAGRGRGRFVVRFIARRRGSFRLVARHVATRQQAAFRSHSLRIRVVYWQAGAGARGDQVALLQRSLLSLGFATPVTGYYDDGTSRAVLAFRKTNNM